MDNINKKEIIEPNSNENIKENKIKEGESNFKKGLNCCQAVLISFKDELNLSEDALLMLGSSFGGGMGRLREVCGAVSAMFIIAGMKYGYTDITNQSDKANHYKLIQELAAKFKEENHSIVCRELLQGIPKINSSTENSNIAEQRTQEYYKKRPCAELVGCATGIVYDLLNCKK